MYGFENLTKNDCAIAFNALKVNAEDLRNSANDAAIRGNFGVARSLIILSSEEFIKGAVLYLRSIGVQAFKIPEVRKALKSHKERHEVVMLFKFFKIIEGIIQLQGYKPAATKKLNILYKASHYINQIVVLFNIIDETGSDLDWWRKANDFKNAGLYVDYRNELMLPQSITKSDFELASNKLKDLHKRFKVFQIILERGEQKERNDLIRSINAGIDFYLSRNK